MQLVANYGRARELRAMAQKWPASESMADLPPLTIRANRKIARSEADWLDVAGPSRKANMPAVTIDEAKAQLSKLIERVEET